MVKFLNKKIGRPTDSPKNKLLQIRVDEDTLSKLDECVENLDVNRSEIIRQSIERLHQDIKK